MAEINNQDSQKSKADKIKNSAGESILYWRQRNSYYYNWLEKIYRFVVRPNSRVLHVGCECGNLLAAVKPSYGVGIDENPNAIEQAKQRFPDLHFYTMDPHKLSLNEKSENCHSEVFLPRCFSRRIYDHSRLVKTGYLRSDILRPVKRGWT